MRVPLIAAACVLACAREAPPPIGQLVLHVDTDAPLPPAPGALATTNALFDALRIDLLDERGPIQGLSREFALDEGILREHRASIGIVAAPGKSTLVARVRMYRYVRQQEGEPSPRTSLETTLRLPTVAADTVTHVAITLRTEDVGRAVGYPEPVEAVPYVEQPSLVASYRHAKRVPCAGAPGAGEVCVPGGLYWFGGGSRSDPADIYTLASERLTLVAPFYIDATETTLRELDALLAKHPEIPPRDEGAGACSHRAEAAVDCVPWETARAVCAARGMKLPTEAQWEWVASGVGADTEWPWGNEVPTCGDANFGAPTECPKGRAIGTPGLFPRDAVTPVAGSGTVFDLAGNVSEWTLDALVRANQPPWSDFGVLIEPLGEVGDGSYRVVRGARVGEHLARTRVTIRRAPSALVAVGVGFRCVRPAT